MLAALAGCGDPKRSDPFGTTDSDGGTTTPDVTAPVDRSNPTGCTTQAQCDDRVPCTDDACVVGGVCEHVPVNSRCGTGQRCFLDRGCASGTACRANSDCDDTVACTRDLCGADGSCQNLNNDALCTGGLVCISTGCAAAGSCAVDRDCDDRHFCNGAERCVSGRCMPGSAPDCSDSDPCTGDVCNDTAGRCDHPAISPCGGGTVTAGTYTVAPPIMYSCAAGSLGPVSSVTLAVTAGGVTVAGFPVLLTGPAPTMGMFTATGRMNGVCTWVYTLSGSFTMPTRFTGSWNLSFDNCLASFGCFSQFGIVTGTRM